MARVVAVAVLVLVLLGGVGVVYEIRNPTPRRSIATPIERPREQPESPPREAGRHDADAYTICERHVRRRLVAPSTAKFDGWLDARYEYKGGGTHIVTAGFDAQNRFGAMLRHTFVCMVTQASPGSWQLDNLAILDG